MLLLLTKRHHEISHCRRTFYRQQRTAACNTAERSIAGGQEIKPLDRKRDEMKENLLVLHLTLLTTFKYV